MEQNKLNDIVNAGIGAIQTSREIFDGLMKDLNNRKEKVEKKFEELKVQGEKDFSVEAVKLKVNLAWNLVRIEEIKSNILKHLPKNEK